MTRTGHPIAITPFEEGHAAEWATFLETADRATLFHDRRFLAYHPPDRFRFGHLLAHRGDKLIAVIPGGLSGSATKPVFTSPLGASVGGPALAPGLNAQATLELVAALQQHARDQGWGGIELTLPPSVYHAPPSDTLEFALFSLGFGLVHRQLCPMIPIAEGGDGRYAQLFRSRFATRVRAGLRGGVRVEQGGLELLEPFRVVFDDTYRRHDAKPTHDAAEIADLLRRLPERVQLHVAFLGDVPVAGLMVMLLNPRVAYSFYICTSTDRANEPGGVVVFASAIDALGAAGYRWLDLGPTARPGYFNAGVTQFKEGLGGIGHCRDRWSWSTGEAPARA